MKLFHKPIIEFDKKRYEENGEWVYKIKFQMDDCKINLNFVGTTKGFKIETKAESWTVALPKAKVIGELILKGKKMQVVGIGYHDHNWNYTLLTLLTYGKGWYWGKIRSETYNLVWANVVKKSGEWDLIAIASIDQNGFYNINPRNITLKLDNYSSTNRHKTPMNYILKIDDHYNSPRIVAEIHMKVKELHYSSVLSAPYWRYHIQTTGYLSINNQEEKIDGIQIMEFLKLGK